MAGDERAAYLAELTGLLWPSGGADQGAPAGASATPGPLAYRVVPSAARPRLLVPAGAARAAAAAVRFSVEATGRRARLRRQALSTAFRLGAGALVCRDTLAVETANGLDTHLAEVLGHPVLLSVQIGPARANRKPVLTLLDRGGAVLGFAKLGVNPLTRGLVDAEAAALRRLAVATAELGPVTVPALRHHGRWGEHALLVQEPLPVWLPRAATIVAVPAQRAALVTLAGCLGTRRAPYRDSPYAARLAASVSALDGADPAARRLAAVVAAVAARADVLPYGCWHGDWNGANSAVLADGRVLVWDWERFEPDVPAGFDALHLTLQGAITRGGVPPSDAADALLAGAARQVTPFGVAPDAATLVGILYLVELGARYLRDRQAEAGARLGRIGDWLLPAVERHSLHIGRKVAQ